MPYVGLGLHFVAALFFAVHVIRSGQQMYWLIILFSFPMLGSIVYFLAVYLPDSRLERGARRIVAAAAKAIDPERELREAQALFDQAPTAQNQMRLAAALLELGHAEEAAKNYVACLKGPFANDQNIRFLAARAFLESGRNEQALAYLQAIRASDGDFRPDEVAILIGRAYGADGRTADARREFESAVERFGTFEVLAEYAIWALDTGNRDTAARLQAEINRITRRWDSNNRYLNAQTLQRLETAYEKSASTQGA